METYKEMVRLLRRVLLVGTYEPVWTPRGNIMMLVLMVSSSITKKDLIESVTALHAALVPYYGTAAAQLIKDVFAD